MVKISEIAGTSTFTWSLDNLPLMATGTVAGALDINFSSSAKLEIWDIFSSSSKHEPIFTAPVDNRFYALAWSKPFEERPQGLIAGAFENGTLEFWDADVLIKTKDLAKASVHKSDKLDGAIKSLQFNPIQNHVLVTGGSKGQIFIWDTKTFSEPFSPGQAMTPMDEITCVSWNNSVSHILASTGNGGYTSIWDLRAKKELLHLAYTGPTGRANFSYVAWHPTQSTKLVTASDNDTCPLILTWDLRNSNAPEKILEGHEKGVLSLDWCKQDPNLLLSSGKDNATLLWNPVEGIKLGEYATTANWAFKTNFAPAAPDIFATASFDGKIVVQSLQDTSPPATTKVSSGDDNEFWSELSIADTQQPIFEVKQAPQWLKNPGSVSFGFGSKLVVVGPDASGKSVIKIQKFIAKGQDKTEKLFKDLKNDDFTTIIEDRLAGETVNDNNKADWEVLKKLSESGKDSLFKEAAKQEETKKEVDGENENKENEEPKEANGDDDFFDKLGNGDAVKKESVFVPEGNFRIFNSNESDDNKQLINLILSNKIEEAVSSCLDQKKLLEALVLALDASDDIKEQVKSAYFKKHKENNLSRVLYNVSSKNVTDLVAHANVDNWKEIAVGISSFTSDAAEYNSKLSELGDRILQSKGGKRNDAVVCYLAGGALDKIANVWLKELPDYETELLSLKTEGVSSPSDARLQALTNFVEKLATYRYITNATGEFSGPMVEPLSKPILEFVNLVAGTGEFDLANKFLQLLPSEFAGTEKERILKATSRDAKPAVGVKATTSRTAAATTAASRSQGRVPQAYEPRNNYAAAPVNTPAAASGTSAYTPAVPQQQVPQPPQQQQPQYGYQPPVSGYGAPSYAGAAPKTNPYARNNPYAPSNNGFGILSPVGPQANLIGTAPVANASVIPPPPPPKANHKQETEGWNDLPDTFKPKSTAPKRAAAAVQSASVSPVPLSAALSQVASAGSVPTVGPPKRTISTSNIAPPPPKSASGSRAPSKNQVPTIPASPKPVVSSRYAPPPAAVPAEGLQAPASVGNSQALHSSPRISKNPYAPSGTEEPPRKLSYASPPGPQLTNNGPLTPSVAPPKNPYAPPPTTAVPHAGIAPPPQKFGSVAPPPQPFGSTNSVPLQPAFSGVPPPPPQAGSGSAGFPPPPPPPAGVSAKIEQPPAQQPEVPAQPKHPQGDRSHIPADSLPIYNSLTTVLEAIKPSIPEKYARHGTDMEQRLNILFDHLNNEEISKPVLELLKQVSSSLEAKDFATATAANVEIATTHSDEIGNWHTGLKRLITMAEAMY
ncbi:Protein transport protein SEC31 [Candida viswanathii]|uniref:Protein transport protein SEC31 n=1 Tax=Candida viswanathii TaxID=5486 RepID=A0A367XRV8_9ASCO|nr:Protein transport protein SEC31 [Candida viswanathii]